MNDDPTTRLSLIARLCDRSDNDAWSEFVQIYQPVIQRFLQKYGMQYADAVDVTQEVLGGVVRSIESWDGSCKGSTFRGWLYRITRNKAVDSIKRESRLNRDLAGGSFDISQFADVDGTHSEADFQMEFERQLFSWAVEKIMPTVKPVNWQAFWQTTVQGRSVKQVAGQLKIDESAVYVARCRIMKRMAKQVQSQLSDSTQPDLGA